MSNNVDFKGDVDKNSHWERFFGFTLNINPIFNLIGIIGLSITRRKNFRFIKTDKFNLYTWAVLAVLGIISIISSYDKGTAISSFFIPFAFFWLYILGRWYIKKPVRLLKDMTRGTALMGFLTIVFYLFRVEVIWQGVELISSFGRGDRAYILGIGDNGLGVLLQAGIVASLGLIFVLKKRNERIEYIIYCVLSLGGLIITKSRGAMVGSAAAIFLLIFVVSWKILLIFGGITGISFKIIPGFLDRVKSIVSLETHMNRIRIYKGVLKMIKDHLWFGTGPGNFHDIYQKYRLPGEFENANTPHSNYLKIISGWGIISGIILYGWIFYIMIRGWFQGGTKYQKIIVAVLVSFWVHVLINDLFAAYSAILLGCLDNKYFK
ncbi:MAG: O-antigen ligase family protein [Halanaerobiales bacterium]